MPALNFMRPPHAGLKLLQLVEGSADASRSSSPQKGGDDFGGEFRREICSFQFAAPPNTAHPPLDLQIWIGPDIGSDSEFRTAWKTTRLAPWPRHLAGQGISCARVIGLP